MDFKQIRELVKLINDTNLTEFKMENDSFKLSIRTKDYKGDKKASIPTVIQTPIQNAPIVQPQHFVQPPVAMPAPVASPVVEQASPAPEPKKEDKSKYLEIKSPMVGTFYRSSSPDKPPFVKVGDTISAGSTVCIVEAMKLFNEIESEIAGKIVKVLVEDASPIEYDQVLYLVEPG